MSGDPRDWWREPGWQHIAVTSLGWEPTQGMDVDQGTVTISIILPTGSDQGKSFELTFVEPRELWHWLRALSREPEQTLRDTFGYEGPPRSAPRTRTTPAAKRAEAVAALRDMGIEL